MKHTTKQQQKSWSHNQQLLSRYQLKPKIAVAPGKFRTFFQSTENGITTEIYNSLDQMATASQKSRVLQLWATANFEPGEDVAAFSGDWTENPKLSGPHQEKSIRNPDWGNRTFVVDCKAGGFSAKVPHELGQHATEALLHDVNHWWRIVYTEDA